jgi:hypothetical protein
MKYIKNIDKLLGNHALGSIIILPIIAAIVNVIAVITKNHGAISGLGSFDLRIFNKILPIQNRLITDRNEIE